MSRSAAKLSIIITSYNVQSYIAESIESIIGQSLEETEIIIVDDGSTDGTVNIIKSYADLDSRIIPILFEKNTIGGVASAANAGLQAASGDYIGFADGDDIYDSEMFGKLYRAAVKYDADLAMCRFALQDAVTGQRVNSDDEKNWKGIQTITALELNDAKKKEILSFSPVPWRKIYRREMLETNSLRFPVGDYFFEDNPFHWASVISARNIVLLPEVLCYHRMARAGQTMSNAGPSLFKLFKHHDNIRHWLRSSKHEEFVPLLIEWTAKQNSWISAKASNADLELLFAELRPIVAQYSHEEIARLPFPEDGRTHKMMAAVKQDRLDIFRSFAAPPEKTGRREKTGVAQATRHSAQIDLDDVYFALMVLQKRIGRLETMMATSAKPSANERSQSGDQLSGGGATLFQRLLRMVRT